MTDAHTQKLNLTLVENVPYHEPRASDPYYHIFEETRARIKKLGLLKCVIQGCKFADAQIELHHDKVEFAWQGGVDLAKFNSFYGLDLKDEDAFRAYIEGPGNLEPLCAVHHRTHLGIHSMPGPLWILLRVWRDDTAPPAETPTS